MGTILGNMLRELSTKSIPVSMTNTSKACTLRITNKNDLKKKCVILRRFGRKMFVSMNWVATIIFGEPSGKWTLTITRRMTTVTILVSIIRGENEKGEGKTTQPN